MDGGLGLQAGGVMRTECSCGGTKDTRALRCKKCDVEHKRASFSDRFWALVDKKGPDECWEWKGFRTSGGYGMYSRKGAHRIAYELTFGPVPTGLWVCHHCDNRECCNPAHLFLGTARDNAMDMVTKGRGVDNSGERNGQAKLTNNQVIEMRRLFASGVPTKELAKSFSLSYHGARAIVTNRVRR